MSVKEETILALRESGDKYISGGELSGKLGVSRNAVWKAVKSLEAEGYKIESITGKGYRLSEDNDVLSPKMIEKYLKTKAFAKGMEVLKEVDSTNNYAKELIKGHKVMHGFTVISDRQTQGKGRLGRRFESPSGSGVYMSIILTENLDMNLSGLITSCASVAVAESVDNLYGTNSKIKWVNDVFMNGKKYCGILTEASLGLESGQLDYVIIGIGVNIKNKKESFPKELEGIVTSIEAECGKSHARANVAAEIINRLEELISNMKTLEFMDEYRRRSFIIGNRITVMKNGEEKEATAVDIDNNAGLIVKYNDGTTETITSGEARIIPKK